MTQRPSVTAFALATLTPVPLLVLGATLGGVWVWAALLYMTLFTFALDQLVAIITPNAPQGVEFPAANPLSVTLALAHFGLLALAIWAVSGGADLGLPERIGLFVAASLFFGQVSNANAHELIHRGAKPLFWLGKLVYISVLYGHHTSAHTKVHHRYVGTPDDPNTARLGEHFYHFAARAWIGSYRAGRRAETKQQRQVGNPRWRHPYLHYVAGALLMMIASYAAFGAAGLIAHLALASYATAQLLLSDYVQHYGLKRAQLDSGRFEPVTDRHSWDSPHWFSSFLMLNAPRHSDHHAHPSRKYPALRLSDDSPTLPYSLPAMAVLALIPPLWRKVMDPRAAKWQNPA